LAEEPGKKDDKFEFTPEGESVEYISRGDALVMAIRHAWENPEIYGDEYQGANLVWEPVSEAEEEEFYDIKLSFWPAGTFIGTPGLEQFVISKTGDIELRQVLESTESKSSSGIPKWLSFGGLGSASIAMIAVVAVMAISGGAAEVVPVETAAPVQETAPLSGAVGTVPASGNLSMETDSGSILTHLPQGAALDGMRPVLVHQRMDFMPYTMDPLVNWAALQHYGGSNPAGVPPCHLQS
jgi:hypothetical protein